MKEGNFHENYPLSFLEIYPLKKRPIRNDRSFGELYF